MTEQRAAIAAESFTRRRLPWSTGIGDNQPYIYGGWVVPVANSWWAPLTGLGYALRIADPGAAAKQKDISPWKRQPPFATVDDGFPLGKTFAKLQDIYDAGRIEPDAMKRVKALWDIFKIHIDDGPFMIGGPAIRPSGRSTSGSLCAT